MGGGDWWYIAVFESERGDQHRVQRHVELVRRPSLPGEVVLRLLLRRTTTIARRVRLRPRPRRLSGEVDAEALWVGLCLGARCRRCADSSSVLGEGQSSGDHDGPPPVDYDRDVRAG